MMVISCVHDCALPSLLLTLPDFSHTLQSLLEAMEQQCVNVPNAGLVANAFLTLLLALFTIHTSCAVLVRSDGAAVRERGKSRTSG